jgi:hypothetical protein
MLMIEKEQQKLRDDGEPIPPSLESIFDFNRATLAFGLAHANQMSKLPAPFQMTGVQQAVVQASLDQFPQGAKQMGRGKRPAGKTFNAK